MIGGDAAVAAAHDAAVKRTLAWLEATTVQTRMRDPETGLLVHAGGQKMVAATFRHEASRNLDPQLHTHAVVANMVQGEDGKWRTMANETLYRRKMLAGMVYRSELARGALGVGIRHREDACGRTLRDCGGPALRDRGVFDEAHRDRGGDGGGWPRKSGEPSSPGGAGGFVHTGPQARRRQGGARRELAGTGVVAWFLGGQGRRGGPRAARAGRGSPRADPGSALRKGRGRKRRSGHGRVAGRRDEAGRGNTPIRRFGPASRVLGDGAPRRARGRVCTLRPSGGGTCLEARCRIRRGPPAAPSMRR